MRIPTSKVWRAFPELDEFSDGECEQFVLRAGQHYSGERARDFALTAGALAVAIPVFAMLARAAWEASRSWLNTASSPQQFLSSGEVAALLLVVMIIFGSAVAFLVVRDRWLIRTITRRIHTASCRGCGYSLLGLAPQGGTIVCPECSTPFYMDESGLTPEDIMSPRDGPRGRAGTR